MLDAVMKLVNEAIMQRSANLIQRELLADLMLADGYEWHTPQPIPGSGELRLEFWNPHRTRMAEGGLASIGGPGPAKLVVTLHLEG